MLFLFEYYFEVDKSSKIVNNRIEEELKLGRTEVKRSGY